MWNTWSTKIQSIIKYLATVSASSQNFLKMQIPGPTHLNKSLLYEVNKTNIKSKKQFLPWIPKRRLMSQNISNPMVVCYTHFPQ